MIDTAWLWIYKTTYLPYEAAGIDSIIAVFHDDAALKAVVEVG